MTTYEISYRHSAEVSHAHGCTPAQAKYNHFNRVGDCFDGFRDFLSEVRSVRKVPHIKGAYDFIERQYGTRFEVGQMVKITGEGATTGKVGEVVHPSGAGAYVTVLLDGATGLFHPMSLIKQSETDRG